MDYQPELKSVRGDLQMEARGGQYMLRGWLKMQKRWSITTHLLCLPFGCKTGGLVQQQSRLLFKQGFLQRRGKSESCPGGCSPGTSEHNLGLAADIVAVLSDARRGVREDRCLQMAQGVQVRLYPPRYPKDKFEKTKVIYEPWHYVSLE